MNEKKNYYAILPAFVRYDTDLSSTSKLIYAEITALTNEKGYCWASNKYFATLFQISDRQVQRVLKQLAEKGYIIVSIENKTKRKIFIIETLDKNVVGGTTKMSRGYDKNVGNNNINNNKKEIIDEDDEPFEELFGYDWLNDKDS